MNQILRLAPRIVRPPWGGTRLSTRFGKGQSGERVGESWEVWRDNVIEGGVWHGRRLGEVVDLPLLVKLVDVAGVLSVQVHPGDADAARLEGAANGKAEGWVVLEAAEDARIAWGLRRTMTRDELRARAESGEIEQDLSWIPARAGAVIDVPPGTIHTLSGEVLFYEVQQPSDLTYRLYDWGRDRPLHLDRAVAVTKQPDSGPHPKPMYLEPGRTRLMAGEKFEVERVEVPLLPRLQLPEWAAVTLVAGRVDLDEEPLRAGTSVVARGNFSTRGAGVLLVAREQRQKS